MAKKKSEPETPALRLEWMDPGELTANPRNYRTHPAEQLTALGDVIGEVGWAGALLFNERTQRLIDGHARKELFEGKGRVPVLVGSWDEATEAKILATLDPIAAMAGADAAKLDALLREVDTGSEALQAMLAGMAEDAGMYQVDGTDAPGLADGDKAPFQQMTFTLHDSQAGTVQRAIDAAKRGGFEGSPNENSNGNALARIAEAYLGSS